MAASIKISELNSLTALTDVDLFLVSDMETGTSRKISYDNLKSNIITGTSSALTVLEGVTAQNKQTAASELESARSTLAGVIATNLSTLVQADTSLDTRIASLESDTTTKTYVDAQVATVLGDAPGLLNSLGELSDALGDDPNLITSLSSRIGGLETTTTTTTYVDNINTTLGSRISSLELDPTTKSYVDTKIAEVSDLAPDSLDTLNELAAALGDDPNLVSGLSTRVASLETNPAFTGIINADDIAIGGTHLTVANSGGVVASVGFFTGGMLTVGGNASLTGNTTFSGGVVNITNGFKLDGTAVTPTAVELNYIAGATSSIQTQINTINTTISNLEIDIAPETLNSINELSAALGDDPSIISNLQAELTAYKAHIEARNLQQGLAFGELYADTLTVG